MEDHDESHDIDMKDIFNMFLETILVDTSMCNKQEWSMGMRRKQLTELLVRVVLLG